MVLNQSIEARVPFAHTVTVAPGQMITDVNFGNRSSLQSQVTGIPDLVSTSVTVVGDANGDGVVSAGDYASVQANFGNTGEPFISGDANGDGVVSAGDYASVQANFGNTSSSTMPSEVLNSTPAESTIIAESQTITLSSSIVSVAGQFATAKAYLPTLQTAWRKTLLTPIGLLKNNSNAIGKRHLKLLSSNTGLQWYSYSSALMQLEELNNYNLSARFGNAVLEDLSMLDALKVI